MSIEFSGAFIPLSTKEATRVRGAVLRGDPSALPVLYGLRRKDGPDIAAVLTMAQQLWPAPDETPLSLASLCESLAEGVGPLAVVSTPNPELRFVDLVATAADLDLWARYRLWVDREGLVQTRACLCAGSVCDEVKRSCALPQPQGAQSIETLLRPPLSQ